MADTGENIKTHLREMTECPICMSAFRDPRMLPCIHTFCFQCLERTSEVTQKKPGDKMPCPLCRKEFIIPAIGMNGVQKNFFMENLLEFKTSLQTGVATIICDLCNVRNEAGEMPKAKMRCLECRDNYCDSCVKVHQYQKLNRDHRMVKIGSNRPTKSEMKRPFTTVNCIKHIQKPLDYYCADCKEIVCVSCFVESHASHKCKDVTTVDEEFRQTIQRNSSKLSIYADELLSLKKNAKIKKADFLKKIVDEENAIHKRNQELKDMIDDHTKSLLDELSVIKSNHLKKMETGIEEIDRCCTILRSFEAYCTELVSKGSPNDICSSVDELIVRVDELEKDRETFIGRPLQSVEISFKTIYLKEVLQKFNNNIVGNIEASTETTTQFENCAIVVGLSDGVTIANDVIKINLHQPAEISTQKQIPTKMAQAAFAAVYCNTVYVTGTGATCNEIWKYNFASGWMKCASLVQGRCRHSAAFIDEVLYICGGFVVSDGSVLDSVEAYNTVNDKCSTVGKLVHCVHSSGNCVPLSSSLYVFGGSDKDENNVGYVQIYDTNHNTCTLLSTKMPRPLRLMRVAIWESSVILIGFRTCFIFNLETENWQERKQFKTEVDYSGLILDSGRLFVIGGGIWEKDKDGKMTWKCRDDVRYVPVQDIIDNKPVEWKIHGKLPKPCLVHAYAKMNFQSGN